ncbi:putative helicase, partial [Xylaria flabelliformis]
SLKRAYPFEAEKQIISHASASFTSSGIQHTSQTQDLDTCFGSIINVKVQLCNIDLLSQWNTWPNSASNSLEIAQEGDYFVLKYGDSRFGRLNKGLCRHLHELVSKQQVRIQAYVSTNDLKTAISPQNYQTPRYVHTEINIYGARADAREVGSILSRSRIFLQKPQHGLDIMEYYNPHILRVEGYSESDSFDHQKEAVDFIFRRETEQISSDLSLWKYNTVDADEPFYQHVFSGAKRPERAEARGGIIADEMGLGKSLVILSIIAGSFDRAREFVAAKNQLFLPQPVKKAASKATLILAPSSLLIDNWVDEIRKYGQHGEIQLLYDRPIVFTTYATVAAEFRRGNDTLTKINWFRIVLDEAHDIRNRSTKQFQAVASIAALHRWCLTGTPIQNSLEDLGALVSFLKVPILEKTPTFRKFITNPMNSTSRSRFQNLRALLQTICLRRTRRLLDLPEPIPNLRRLDFTSSEQSQYDDLFAQCRVSIDMAVSRRGKRNTQSAFLESLLRLRLFCNNGCSNATLQLGPKGLPVDPDEALMYLQQQRQDVCVYCDGTIYFANETAETDGGVFVSSCCHLVCHNCLPHYHAQKQRCPICVPDKRSTSKAISPPCGMRSDSIKPSKPTNIQPVGPYPSKLLALLSDVRQNLTDKR